MYDLLLSQLSKRKNPLEIIVVGLGFMGSGFILGFQKTPGVRIPILISRRPNESAYQLRKIGFRVKIENRISKIKDLSKKGYICVSDDLEVVKNYENEVVIEMTGNVYYGTEVALAAFAGNKHLVTMNPELQATVGTELKKIADEKKLIITDVIGDQPGSLSRMISKARLMGFKVLVAGNMKRFLNLHATQGMMSSWARKFGLSPRQTTSFTDGTKQAIEMNLVANYFGMNILKPGMTGPGIENIDEALKSFNFKKIPKNGIVDYVIGSNLFPGVFLIVEHNDINQKKYLKYLKMGNGPRYVLFEPYHLCHLEALVTVLETVLFNHETINNGLFLTTQTVACAKNNLVNGQMLDGIGGDKVYGKIVRIGDSSGLLPVGFTESAILKKDVEQDKPIRREDVELPINSATKIANLT